MPDTISSTKNNATTVPQLTVEDVLKNVIPIPTSVHVDCERMCVFSGKFCVPCRYKDKTEYHYVLWQKLPNCSPEFFEILKQMDLSTVKDIMQQALETYIVYTKIIPLISTNLTPHRCNNLFPACYLCHLGEHPDLCQNLGCSCRNSNEKDSFVNYVWHKNENFGSDNFVGVLGKYDPKDIKAAVQILIFNLIQDNKLPSIQ